MSGTFEDTEVDGMQEGHGRVVCKPKTGGIPWAETAISSPTRAPVASDGEMVDFPTVRWLEHGY